MAFIDDGSSELARNLMLLGQQIQNKRQFKAKQAEDARQFDAQLAQQRHAAVLKAWADRPGTAIENIPGAVESYTAIFGKPPAPGQIASEMTREQMAAHTAGQPGNESLRETSDVNIITGQAGPNTRESFETGRGTANIAARTAQTNAGTAGRIAEVNRGLIDAAATDIEAATPQQRGRAGQAMILPGGNTLATLDSVDARANLQTRMSLLAQKAIDDPNSPEFKQMDQSIRQATGNKAGFLAAMTAVQTGTDDFLRILGQMTATERANSQNVQREQNAVANEISKNSGGFFSPDEVIAYWDYQASGKQIPEIENNPKYQTFKRSQQLGGQAYLEAQADQNSPMRRLIEGYQTIVANGDLDGAKLNALNAIYQNNAADIIVGSRMGPRAASEHDPALLAQWDRAKAIVMNQVPLLNPDISMLDRYRGNTEAFGDSPIGGWEGGYNTRYTPRNAAVQNFLDISRSMNLPNPGRMSDLTGGNPTLNRGGLPGVVDQGTEQPRATP